MQNGDGVAAVPVLVGNFNDQFIEIRSGLGREGSGGLTPPASAGDASDLGGSVLSTGDTRPDPAPATAKKSPDPSRL